MADAADRVIIVITVITMGCGVDAQACPTRVRPMREDWGLDDPQGQPVETVRAIRDQIVQKAEALLGELAAEADESKTAAGRPG
jgi:arsenate reductase